MGRKITLSYLSNDTERKASYKKRKNGLIKKVSELSTLCGVEACAIIYGKDDQEPVVWPSHEQAQQVLEKFQMLSEGERTKKQVSQEDYSKECINKVKTQLQCLEKENRCKEIELFLYRVIAGEASLQEIDMSLAAEMSAVIQQIRCELKSRIKALRGNNVT